jgi:hypothetical protein
MNMQSEEINELADALSKAQGLIEGASKDSKNPFFKSSYADLHSVMACAREPLASNGLSVVQPTQVIDGQLCLITMIMHKSGQWIKSVMPLVLAKNDPQSVGSSLTYFRRYCYASLCGVAQMDDDAESAMERKVKDVPAKASDQPTIGALMMALAKIDTHIDKSKLADFMAKFAVAKNTTVEAVIKSALTTPEQLGKLNKHIEEFLLGTEPTAA